MTRCFPADPYPQGLSRWGRATARLVAKMAKLPVVPNPGGLRMQPVDAREVAARLVQLTLAEPAGFAADPGTRSWEDFLTEQVG